MRIHKTTLAIILTCACIIYLIHRKRVKNLVNLKSVLQYALHSCENGGKAILKSKGNLVIKTKGLTKEGMEDKVTSADYLSHCSMVKTIHDRFPSLTVISEEADTLCPNNILIDNLENEIEAYLDMLEDEWVKAEDVAIWIDPLDATQEFTEKLYQYVTTMVCVSLRGKPIIGVIHKPFQNITSWAWVGRSQSYDLNSRSKVDNKKLTISISRSHSGKIKEMLDQKLKDYELVVAAGAGYKSLQVAYGEVDAYLHVTAIKKWDICAGNAIIEALGGEVSDKNNQRIDYSRESNKINENGLIATLREHSTFLNVLV